MGQESGRRLKENFVKDKYVIMAKLGAPYGILGWIKVYPNTEELESLIDYTSWFVGQPNRWQSYAVEDCKVHNNALLVKLSGFSSPEAVACLTNQQVAIKREQLPDLEEDEGYYWADLEGLTVVSLANQVLGKVAYLYEAGASDILVVRQDKTEQHIPFIEDEVVKEVSLEEQRIVVDWETGV